MLQALDPGAELVLAVQLIQLDEDVTPVEERYLPAPQLVQREVPVTRLLNVPVAHAVHTLEVGAARTLP